MNEPIRIFIGTEPAQFLATEVLKRSVLRRTEAKVEFHDLIGIDLNLKLKMYTGFSFYRFAIPEKCNYEGRAIYLDADIVVLGDIAGLYTKEMNGYKALARLHKDTGAFTSVMLMDCAKLTSWKIKDWVALINAGLTSYPNTMNGSPGGMNYGDFGPLEPIYNDFDHYNEKTQIIHYTNVPTQPWKKGGHPYRAAFLLELKKCLEEGSLTYEDVEKEIQKGFIYPAIIEDMRALE